MNGVRRLPLFGVRIHLSGSVPENATDREVAGIVSFVHKLTQVALSEGATIVHGSHPTLMGPLEDAARAYMGAGGAKGALTLVRSQHFASTPEQIAEVEAQREYAVVEIIPAAHGDGAEALVPMREWMADRCDVTVAVGGRWNEVNKAQAGVPAEVEEARARGKPVFAVAGFGGAIAAYVHDDPVVLGKLNNGWSDVQNRALAAETDVDQLAQRVISQIKLLPLFRRSVSSGRLFRILALDGGGIRGVFTAAVLAKWDDMLKSGGGNQLVRNFDLVAGTSTGALLAIGLALGMTPAEMLRFYREQGPKIFPKDRQLRHWLKSKYESATLRSTLTSVFGDKTLANDSCCRLVIPTVRAIRGESEVIVTPHSLDRTAFAAVSAVDAALASSAAPTYFDDAAIDDKIVVEKYLDGGIWANNPVLPAIAEAVRHLGIPIDRIDVLSVGTLGAEADFTAALSKGKAGWAPTSVDLFFAAQEHAAVELGTSFLSAARHLRVNQLTPSEIKLDDVDAIEDMAQRGADVGKDSFVAVRSRFLDGLHCPDWRSFRR